MSSLSDPDQRLPFSAGRGWTAFLGLLALTLAMATASWLAALPSSEQAASAAPQRAGWMLRHNARVALPPEVLMPGTTREDMAIEDIEDWTVIFEEDFESPTWPAAADWLVFDNNGDEFGEYQWASRCRAASGAAGAWAVGGGAAGSLLPCFAAYPNRAQSWMITRAFDLSDATDAEVSFSYWVNTECVGTRCVDKADWLYGWVSTDGEDWSGVKIAGDFTTGDGAGPDGWREHRMSLVDYIGEPTLWLAFTFDSDADTVVAGGGAHVDDVRVRVDRCPRTATVRAASTDRSCYTPGSTIGVFADVATSLGSQRVQVEAALWYSPDIVLDMSEVTFTAPGQRVLSLQVPTDLGGLPIEAGDYELSVTIWDADSNCYQDTRTIMVRIDPICGSVTPPVSATPTGPATRTPTPFVTPDVEATLCPGETFHETKRIFLPPAPARADVLFVIDTTGSMADVISSAKANAVALMNTLTGHIPDIQFGVVDLRDYPIEPFGDTGDWPYRLRQPITGNRAAVETAIQATGAGGGNDYPEGYSRALFESYSDGNIGWRTDARRFVVSFGDSVPHDDNLNEGIANPPNNPGGADCYNDQCMLDPGRDGIPGTADDLNFQTVLDGMAAARITLLHVVAGQAGAEEANLVTYWGHFARRTNAGGNAVPMADTSRLVTVIEDLITSAGRNISRLELVADPSQYQSWLRVEPPAFTDISIPAGGMWVTFEVDITVPHGTPLGTTHRFSVRAVGDGAVYGGQHVTIHVPPDCYTPTPTPTGRGSSTPTPTRHATYTPTPTATAFVCPPVRPGVAPTCPEPNFVRNAYFESGARSWGQWSNQGRTLVDTSALEGFFSAHFDGAAGSVGDEWLFQMIDVPPEVTAASFDVAEVSRYNFALNPPKPTGSDHFHASIYDATLTQELVRMWEFDPLLPIDCPIDAPSYNLTPAQLNAIRGRRIALAFHFQKTTVAWQAGTILDGIQFTICSPSPPCRVEGDKTAHPSVVAPGGEVTVLLSLTGLDGDCLPRRKPADVILVVDRSGSMEGGKLSAAKTAAKAFIDRLDLSVDQVGLVSYADTAILNRSLGRYAGPIRGEIDRMAAAGETNIADALDTAQAELAGPRHRPGNLPVIILLSDGRPSPGTADPLGAAEAAKIAGSRIYTIGLGGDVDPDLLRGIASGGAGYFYAPSAAELAAIYAQISGLLGGDPATDITIVDRLSPHVTLIPASFIGNPAPTVSPDGRTLTWRIPRLGLETRQWGYRVRMTSVPGTWPTNDSAVATYTSSQGQPGTVVFPIPQVTVLPPEEGHPDALCRDHEADDGDVPSNLGGQAWWDSPDIWVRHAADGGAIHQNPVTGRVNTIYVRIRNRGRDAANNVRVTVYEATGAANIAWPGGWVPAIGTATIPSLGAGRTAVVAIPWTPSRSGHFCFLARIEADGDAVVNEGWVPFDNNLCQKNVQIIEGGSGTSSIGAGNRWIGPAKGKLRLDVSGMPPGSSGRLTFKSRSLFDAWRNGGGEAEGGTVDETSASVRFAAPLSPLAGMDAAPFEVVVDRVPFEGEQFESFEITFEGGDDQDPPTISVEQWVDGAPVGGVFIRPARRPTIYLPAARQSLP